MATVFTLNRQVEEIRVIDASGDDALMWRVATDDENVERMMAEVSDAMKRFHALGIDAAKAETEEQKAAAQDATLRLIKRTIVAVAGEKGYEDALEFIGGGEKADPAMNVVNLGELFAQLCLWLDERCASRHMKEAAAAFGKATAAKAAKGGKKGR